MADAGFRLTVEGEKEFKAALASIDQQIKINKAQIKLLTQEYNLNEDGMQTLTTKQSVLQSTYDEQAKKVAALDDKYKAMAATYGETDKRVATLKVQMLDAATAMAKTEAEIKKNADAMDAYQAEVDGSGQTAKKLSESLELVEAKLAANKAEVDRIAQSYEKGDRSAKGYEARNKALAEQNEQLTARMEQQREKIELLSKAMEKAADTYGENSIEVQKYKKQLAEAQTEIDKTSKTIEENTNTMNSGANPLLDTIKDLTQQAGIKLPGGLDKAIGKMGELGEIAGDVAVAIEITKGIIKTISNASDSFSDLKSNAQLLGLDTTEYQKLEYALSRVGVSAEGLEEIMNPLYSKIREADTALADYANGTKKFGEATGVLAMNIEDQQKKIYLLGTAMMEAEEIYGENSDAVKSYERRLSEAQEELKAMQAQVVESDDAAKEAAKTWDELGVSLYDSQGNLRDITDIFYDLIGAYSETTSSTERITKMQEIFGETANKVNEIVENGGTALRQYADEAEKTGKVLNESTVQALDNVNTAIGKFKQNLENAKNSLGALLVGLLTFNGDLISDAWSGIKGSVKGMFTGYADGTFNHPGGLALVGERGPELLRLPTGSQVYPTGVSQPMMQSARGGGDTYNITIDAKSVREFNDIVRIAKSARQNGRMGVAE